MTTTTLLCWNYSNARGVRVKVQPPDIVYDLKERIKLQEKPGFDDVPTGALDVWKACIPVSKTKEEFSEAVNAIVENEQPLEFYKHISDIFTEEELSSGQIH